eukprot:1588391-Pyramimonas_sp.AAC.1
MCVSRPLGLSSAPRPVDVRVSAGTGIWGRWRETATALSVCRVTTESCCTFVRTAPVMSVEGLLSSPTS